ncbi:hypothetical protein ACFWDI_08345 [Streptomyces sp. NPDC060064]|uniref:hypothetical protein n=1 Tax=Streptomyces sp. NPDC060064 TaxID=3347049 RepID=UPI003682B3B0
MIGAVFVLQEWEGEPCNAEPNMHSELVWVDPHDPPADSHNFTQEVLRAFVASDLYVNVG